MTNIVRTISRILLITLIAVCVAGCKTTSPKSDEWKDNVPFLHLKEQVYTHEQYNCVDYLGGTWMVIPSPAYTFEAMLMTEMQDYELLVTQISLEMMQLEDAKSIRVVVNQPTEDMLNTPYYEDLFALPNNRPVDPMETVFWWYNDRFVVRLITCEGYPGILPSFAVITVHQMDAYHSMMEAKKTAEDSVEIEVSIVT